MCTLYLVLGSIFIVTAQEHYAVTNSHNVYLIVAAMAAYFMAGCHLVADAVKQRKDG